ncbi:MAG TPA: arginine repressor [Acidobacteriota bacterium]|nr:arginine repressor [Acidobacteriota bacterium]
MASKTARHGRILEIVRKRAVSSQGELCTLLEAGGVVVTQSTLSRDVRDLGLVKVRGVYRVPGMANGTPPEDLLRRSFSQLIVKSGVSGNILVVKTLPGNAHSLGVVLDAAQWPEVLGTVAGDDTVFVLLRSNRMGRRVLRRLEGLVA